MQEATETDWERVVTDKFKACIGCKFRVKERNAVLDDKQVGTVYGCCLGQHELTTDIEKVPEQCRLKNMTATKETYRPFAIKKERDNCRICMVYMDMKPICKREDIKLKGNCPCKTCEQFMASDKGCLSFKDECKSKLQYEVVREG
jgi:hypothetical protein